ncbi:helix-turn-helix transcriptional regulator [Desulfitobacterium hafniense]|uniref:helix-turn-helix transcriptional regulator n=1 Tax=Desulfitobacterium hafniense TaxID=49338 RepID=UPI0003652926|nr:helix-turn-helix transcriptional regulator [Desulfitobacterium hafniense]
MSTIPSRQLPNVLAASKQQFCFDPVSGSFSQDKLLFEQSDALFALLLLPAGDNPVHCSSSHVSILFCGGPATVLIGQQKTTCFAGNIFLFRSQCNFVVEPKDGAEIYLALYKKELFDSLFISMLADCHLIYSFFGLSNCKDEFLYFDCSREMPIQQFAKALQLELSNTDDLSVKTVRCSTVLFMTNLNRIHRTHLVINESSMMKDYLIGDILKYMSDHFTTATLASTAAHFNYHPAYFSAMFQKKALCNFTTKMQEMRLEQARRLLVSTELSVQNISESTGFHDKSYFYRCFKATYGLTPGGYRRKYADEKNILTEKLDI